jgi:hypothetical protein
VACALRCSGACGAGAGPGVANAWPIGAVPPEPTLRANLGGAAAAARCFPPGPVPARRCAGAPRGARPAWASALSASRARATRAAAPLQLPRPPAPRHPAPHSCLAPAQGQAGHHRKGCCSDAPQQAGLHTSQMGPRCIPGASQVGPWWVPGASQREEGWLAGRSAAVGSAGCAQPGVRQMAGPGGGTHHQRDLLAHAFFPVRDLHVVPSGDERARPPLPVPQLRSDHQRPARQPALQGSRPCSGVACAARRGQRERSGAAAWQRALGRQRGPALGKSGQ